MTEIENNFNREFFLELGEEEHLSVANMKLRYQVWCLENNYFPPSTYIDSKESDEYDTRSVYVVLSNRKRQIDIATARVILYDRYNPDAKFPIENFVMLRRHERDLYWGVPRERIGEISRFCVSKVFRRRALESSTIHGISSLEYHSCSTGKRSYSYITLGLFKGLIQASLDNNLEYWYALMEPSLLKLLRLYGIRFTSVGPLVNYFGMRQPCIASIDSVLNGIRRHSNEIGDFTCPLRAHSLVASDQLVRPTVP